MTPAQRIVRLLAARGREATPNEAQAWMNDYLSDDRWVSKRARPSEEQIATALERGAKAITMILHLKFGDALSRTTEEE